MMQGFCSRWLREERRTPGIVMPAELPSRAAEALVAHLADRDFGAMLALCATCRSLRALQWPLRTLVVFGPAVFSRNEADCALPGADARSSRTGAEELGSFVHACDGGFDELYRARDETGGVYATMSALDDVLRRIPCGVQRGVTTLMLPRLRLRGDCDPCPPGLGYAQHLSGLRQLHAAVRVAVPAVASDGSECIRQPRNTRLADCVLRIALASYASLRALSVTAPICVHGPDVVALARLLGGTLDTCIIDLTPYVPHRAQCSTVDEGAALQAQVREACANPAARIVCRMDARQPPPWPRGADAMIGRTDLPLHSKMDAQRLLHSTEVRAMVARTVYTEPSDVRLRLRVYAARRHAWIVRALRQGPDRDYPRREAGHYTAVHAARWIDWRFQALLATQSISEQWARRTW